MDPQQRVLLEAVARCRRSQDHRGEAVTTGVFVGVQHAEYAHMVGELTSGPNPFTATGTALSVVSGRVAYFFGLSGPALSIDTACSASLVATHTAAHWCAGSVASPSALACGVCLLLAPWNSLAIARAGMLAADGRCKTLDMSADGYSRAESVGVISLRRSEGEIHGAALLLGSTVNQDGRSSSLTAPNGRAQTQAIVECCLVAGVAPGDVQALEMHGTGTALGDPIEVNAASAALCDDSSSRRRALQFAAAKSHVGHAESAAGLVGVGAAVSGVAGAEFRPLVHLRNVNTFIATGGIVAFPRQRAGAARTDGGEGIRSGVSSFAFQGTNAHVLVQSTMPGGSLAAVGAADLPWERTRSWHTHAPLRAHGPLTKLAPSWSPELAYIQPCFDGAHAETLLKGHAVLDRLVVCPSVLMDTALATGQLLGLFAHGAALIHLAFPSPAVLSAVQTPRLTVVARRAGGLEVRGSGAVHFIAAAAALFPACHAGLPQQTHAQLPAARLKRRALVAALRQSPTEAAAVGHVVHPAVLESLLLALHQPGGRTSNDAAESESALLIVTAAQSVFVDTGCCRRASLQSPWLTKRKGDRPIRWASDRLLGVADDGAVCVDMAGVLASAAEHCLAASAAAEHSPPPESRHVASRPDVAADAPSWTKQQLEECLRACVESASGAPLDFDTSLQAYGIDSIGWVEIRNSLQEVLGVQLDVSDFLEADSAHTVVDRLAALLVEAASGAAPAHTPAHMPSRRELPAESSTSLAVAVPEQAAEVPGELTKMLRPAGVHAEVVIHPLFLGAPAFGDGSLAYMSLAKALQVDIAGFVQPIITLERDDDTPWPILAQAHAEVMLSSQPGRELLMGGHSLGGLLALETAIHLEERGRTVGAVFLMDSSHPNQFKPSWMDPTDNVVHGSDTSRHRRRVRRTLEQLEVQMRSLNFDFDDVGWRALDDEEKLRVFEDLTYQALGRHYDMNELVDRLGGDKPMAEMWSSGITRSPSGRMDTSSWRLMSAGPAFRRVQAPVVFFRSGQDDESLFDFVFRDEFNTSSYIHGYRWAHCCDNLRIIEGASNHFTLLMPFDTVGGDLDTTVVPAMSRWLRRFWGSDAEEEERPPARPSSWLLEDPAEDIILPELLVTLQQQLTAAPAAAEGEAPVVEQLPPQPEAIAVRVERPRVEAEHWVRVVWSLEEHLPMFAEPLVAASAQPGPTGVALPDLDDNLGRLAVGLNELAWVVCEESSSDLTTVFIFHDLMADAGDLWTQVAFAATLPVFALHVSPTALADAVPSFGAADDATPLALQYLDAIRACMPPGGANCILAGLSTKTAALAQEVATQLALRRGDHLQKAVRSTVAVLIHHPSLEAHEMVGQRRAESAAYQALYAAAAASAPDEPPTWGAFISCLDRCPSLPEQLELLADGRPPSTSRAVWDSEIESDVRRGLGLFDLARNRLPWPVMSAHLAVLADDGVQVPQIPRRLHRSSSFARLMRAGRMLFTRRDSA